MTSCKDLPRLLEVDSKLTLDSEVSTVLMQSGIMQVPVSGAKLYVTWSMNYLTNLVSAATPAAGLHPKKKVKFATYPSPSSSTPPPRAYLPSAYSPFFFPS